METVTAIATLLIALSALALSLEARWKDRPQVRARWQVPTMIVGGGPGSGEPEQLDTSLLLFNVGRRPTALVAVEATIAAGGLRQDLANLSASLFKTVRLPTPLPGDSATALDITWALGADSELGRRHGHLGGIPRDGSLALSLELADGRRLGQTWGVGALTRFPYAKAQEYRDAFRAIEEQD